ncbi:penicillin-binding protein 2 [Alphaproteobacteria bacterium]
MRDHSKKCRLFSRRALVLSCIKLLGFSLLSGRFFYLQIKQNKKFRTLSDNNRIKLQILPPIRGNIIDSLGDAVAINSSSYRVELNPMFIDVAEAVVEKIGAILDCKTSISQIGVQNAIKKSLVHKIPIIIQNHLSFKDIVKIEVCLDLIGKVEIVKVQHRLYKAGKLWGHIIGYVSKPSLQEVKTASIPNYREFEIGKNGVEKYFEVQLQGTPTIRKTEVDVLGRFVRELNLSYGIPGQNLQLSVDSTIQSKICDIMGDLKGAVILLNPLNGQVVSSHSSPTYDPNKFVGGINSQDWRELLNNPDKPLINKVISTPYPPGSTFKLVTALAILRSGIDPQEKILCTGEYKLGNHTFHCWNKYGHGYMNFQNAIASSCNVYFYIQGLRAGINKIADTARLLGLGDKTGIELPFENQGIVPNHSWKVDKFKQSWHAGDTINATIGQGYLLVTPIQLATMVARIVTGKCISPTLLTQISNTAEISDLENINPMHLQMIKQGMYMVFNSPIGTGYINRVTVPGRELAGKSGTAQVISQRQFVEIQNKEHGLFVGFWPYDQPQYVMSIVIEHGGWGSRSTVPIAKQLIESL